MSKLSLSTLAAQEEGSEGGNLFIYLFIFWCREIKLDSNKAQIKLSFGFNQAQLRLKSVSDEVQIRLTSGPN